MKKIVIQEESINGLEISIEKEIGKDCFKFSMGNQPSIEISRGEMLMLQSMIAEILEN